MDLRSIEIRIQRSENLPVLPQVVSSILHLADKPDTSARDLEKLIERDSAITAKVLRVANSPFYGGNKVNTISRAITFLGMNTLRSMIVSVAYQQLLAGNPVSRRFNKLEFWKHSLAVATCARILGRMKMPVKSEELYLAGMMHDVGYLIFDRLLPRELDDSIHMSSNLGVPIYDAQRSSLGFDHTDLGDLLAEKWQMSQLVRHAVRYHHRPEDDGDYYETTCIISAANILAHQCGLTNSAPEAAYEIDQKVANAIGLPTEQFEIIKQVMMAEVEKAQATFHMAA